MTMGAVSDKEKGLSEWAVPSSPGMFKFTWNLNSTHVGILLVSVNFVKS